MALLASCGAKSEDEKSRTLVIGRASDAIALDPARITDSESVEICNQIFESLLRYKPGTNTVEASLAESWNVSSNGREWNFALRQGVKFHDGSDLNAEAVVFSFLRQFDRKHPYHLLDSAGGNFAWQATYNNIVSVKATSEYSLQIVIDRPFAPFAANLAMFPVSIVSPSAVKKWGDEFHRHPVGTGPFTFRSWQEGRIVLERNSEYWGVKPTVRRLVFKAISDARERLTALESGAVHLAYSILPDDQQFVSLHPQLQLYRAGANNVAYLAINTTRPPFDDLRVRRAINYAINKEPILKLAYQGMALVADGALPPGQWGYVPESFSYDYDLGKARALLDEVIMEGSFDFETAIELYVPTTPRAYLPDPAMVSKIVKANLESLGLRVNLVAQEFSAHLGSIRAGEHDVSLIGWVGDNGDPDNYLYVLFDQDNAELGSARNLSFLKDAQVHEMLLEARKVDSRAERVAIYTRAQKRIGGLAPWVPLVHSQTAVVANARVSGVSFSTSGHVLFSQVELH